MYELDKILKQIKPINQEAVQTSKQHWDNIAKPLNGLGLLEQFISQIAGIQGSADVKINNKTIVVMCADNGVVAEGVAQSDNSVTAIVSKNIAKGIASVNRMAAVANADVIAIDIGIYEDVSGSKLIDKKIINGTKNMSKEPAMTEAEVLLAIQTGIETVKQLKEKGVHILGTGEMGIGNTTTSSALASVLLGLSVEDVTGKGAGLSKEGVAHKIEVIQKAIILNKPNKEKPLDVLAKVGGLDIAGLVGVFIGGALYKMPVVLDGFIAGVSALLAVRLCPNCLGYMLPSHMGNEPGCVRLMQELHMEPIIHGQLALGEGTGAAILFSMLDMAYEVYSENSTFEEAQIEAYQKYEQ